MKAHRLTIDFLRKHEHWRCGKSCCMAWEYKVHCLCGGWKQAGTAGSLWTKQMLIELIREEYRTEHLSKEKP